MFSEDFISKVFLAPETQNIPFGHVSDVVRLIERLLEEEDANKFQSYSGITDDLSFM